MITVVNLGISNIGSVCKALDYLKLKYTLTDSVDGVEAAEKILLPGVGSFNAGMKAIHERNLFGPLRDKASKEKIPFFGVCLGMQLLLSRGTEGGDNDGLGLIEGGVFPLGIDRSRFAVPHMGWNDVDTAGLQMFEGISANSCFYFVHSFEAKPTQPETKTAATEYGNHKIVAAVENANIWGAQFHPERSQRVGLQILKNLASFQC